MIRTKWRDGARRTLVAATLAAGLITACGGGDDDDNAASQSTSEGTASDTSSGTGVDPSDATSAGPKDGGTLNFYTLPDWPTLDPGTAQGVSIVAATRFPAIFDGLAFEDPVTGEVRNRLAESFTSSDDQTWVLTLRPDVQFSDETAFDAAAVKSHWERVQDPDTQSPFRAVAAEMQTIEVVDPLTLRVTLAEPNGQWPRTVATTPLTFVPSPTALASLGPSEFGKAPVGAGPFVVTRFVPEDTLELTKNPNYYGEVHLDKVVFKVITDHSQRLATLQTEPGIGQFTAPTVEQELDDAGLPYFTNAPSGGNLLLFNMSKPPFDDPIARRALQKAIDVEALNETIFQGLGEPISTIIRENSPYHTPAVSQESDRDEAQALFDEYASVHGEPLRFTLTSLPSWAPVANYLSALLDEYDNVEMTIDEIAQTALIERFVQGGHEAAIFVCYAVDPAGLAECFLPGMSRNYMRYDNPTVTAAFEAGLVSGPEAARAEAYEIVQRELLKDVPVVWLYRLPTTHGHHASIHTGGTVTGFGAPLLDEVWIG